MGDTGCQEIVDSGILKRLKILDICHGCISDRGARILADCQDIKNLELLDIDRNGLTGEGIRTLRKALGKRVRADNQLTSSEVTGGEFLCEGESE